MNYDTLTNTLSATDRDKQKNPFMLTCLLIYQESEQMISFHILELSLDDKRRKKINTS